VDRAHLWGGVEITQMSPDKEPINMISDIYPAPTCDRPAPKLFSVRSGVIVYE